jgi:PEGA domain
MEFLSPNEKRKKTIQLFVGYGLMAILIALAALILIFVAEGYGYDPNKGVSQSGLVFFNSTPTGANIYFNNQLQGSQTNTKFSLLNGTYKVSVNKDQYIDWNKQINVDGGTVRYYDYIRLFPKNVPVGITQVFDAPPVWVSQSPNGQWLLLQPNNQTPNITVIDTRNPTTAAKTISIPQSLVTSEYSDPGSFSAIGWADDNNHLLILQTLPSGKKDYLVIDVANPNSSVNLTNNLNIPQTATVMFFNQKSNQYLLFDKTAGTIKLADSSNIQNTPLLSNVVAFKAFADNLILYVSYTANNSMATVSVLSNKKDRYTLEPIAKDPNDHYLLDMAQYSGRWYYVVSSSAQNKVIVYRDPLNNATAGSSTPITPRLALLLDNPQFASFSTSARFLGMQSGNKFIVFDAELDHVNRFTVDLPIAANVQAKWMDTSHYSVVADGSERVFEFDGSNVTKLTSSIDAQRAYFSPDNSYVYTFIKEVNGKIGFENGKLVL